MLNQCDFCNLKQTRGTKLFKSLYGIDQILDTPKLTSFFALIQDSFPLGIDGAHLLLIPNKYHGHYTSFASIENKMAIVNARSLVINKLNLIFPNNPIFIFEHGSGMIEDKKIECGGCHISHAHAHFLVIPRGHTLSMIKEEVDHNLSKSGWRNSQSRSLFHDNPLTDLKEITENSPYLHFSMITLYLNETVTYVQKKISEQLESQLMRRIVSKIIYNREDTSYWNWQDIASGFTSRERLEELKHNILFFRSLF